MIEEKRWDKDMEEGIIEEWSQSPEIFDTESKKESFSIDTPPPYPSGKWHIGAVAHFSLIDMIARSQRLLGKNVLFPWGVDRNGINIELVVEKKYKKSLHEWDREEFIKTCKEEIEPFSMELESTAKRIGMSCDFSKPYYTDSPEYRAASQAAFIELWKKGMIAEDLRPNTYCTDCKTTIADAEVYYEEKETSLVHVLWETEDGEKVSIATTRPELISACQAVLVNPDDDRYTHLHGKSINLPLFKRAVKIIPHSYVDASYGSGVMMISSYGDFSDVKMFRELKLEPIAAIGMDSRMTDAAGAYKGLKVNEAREKITEDLKSEGLVEKEEKIIHKAPICERSKTPIEIINLKEWYVKQVDHIEDLKKRVGEMNFYPEKHRQLLLDWIDNVTIDWPISRRRYYHTEIPIWYCNGCDMAMVPEPGKYYQPWKDKPPFEKCECGSSDFNGEEKVFDTWMDSSISNMYILGYPEMKDDMFPVSLRPQGRDIVRTWLYYTLLKSHLLKDEKPFENVWITGMGLDEHGRKMSKSLGNVMNPEEIIEKYGADAFRLWAASETNIGEDYRISEERIEGAMKTLMKMWNVCRFISQWERPSEMPKLNMLDEWMVHETNSLIEEVRKSYSSFDLHNPALKSRNFLWEVFASHYVEMAKSRAYNQDGIYSKEDQESATWTLHYVLESLLKILAPISPFSSYKLYKELYGEDIRFGVLGDVAFVEKPSFSAQEVMDFNSTVWKLKKDQGKSLKDEIDDVVLPESLKPIERDLKAVHKIKNITYG